MPRSAAAPAASALPFLPQRPTLASLRRAVQACRGCPLYRDATQAVFGAGRRRARLLVVGEQPGNAEDLAGQPFVGPAGRVLDAALAAAGIDRDEVYVTNVVKHFEHELRGKGRLHKTPGAREIAACLPWLQKELERVRPSVLVCLGATAAQSLLGRAFKVSRERGRDVASNLAPHVVATVHPSSILRQRTRADRARAMRAFVADLAAAARLR